MDHQYSLELQLHRADQGIDIFNNLPEDALSSHEGSREALVNLRGLEMINRVLKQKNILLIYNITFMFSGFFFSFF